MPRFTAADSSTLIGLAIAGAFEALRELFGTVTITRTVLEELRAGEGLPGTAELETALRDGWIRVAPTPSGTWAFTALDAGEASTIALALTHAGKADAEPPLVLMDDALGRAQAAASGLELLDLPAVLLVAKRAGLIARVAPLLARLARRGFTVSESARRAVLEETGESDPP